MYAVVETGGKQYKVCVGDEIFVEKLEVEAGATVELKTLMVCDEGNVKTGEEAAAVKVVATAEKNVKGAKIVVYKYKPKKNVRKKQGHRQTYTKLKIASIG
jgi:large subunit ribosomal protein L21